MAQHISQPQSQKRLQLVPLQDSESFPRSLQADILVVGCSDFDNPNPLAAFGRLDVIQLCNFGNNVAVYDPAHEDARRLNTMLANARIQHVVVLGHTHCSTLETLYHECRGGQATDPACDLIWRHYAHLDMEAQLNALAQENVLVQLENLLTYPAIRQRLKERNISLNGWIYEKETWQLYCYDNDEEQFVPLSDLQLPVRGLHII